MRLSWPASVQSSRHDYWIDQDQFGKRLGHERCSHYQRMPAHRVTDASCTLKTESACQPGGIVAEFVPFVRRLRSRAGAVPAHIKRDRPAKGYPADDLTPAVRVKASGVREQNRRFRTGALPNCQPRTIRIEELRTGQRRIRHSLDSRPQLRSDLIRVWSLRSNHSIVPD